MTWDEIVALDDAQLLEELADAGVLEDRLDMMALGIAVPLAMHKNLVDDIAHGGGWRVEWSRDRHHFLPTIEAESRRELCRLTLWRAQRNEEAP